MIYMMGFCKALFNEMDKYLKWSDGNASRSRFKRRKPYWNNDLTEQWVKMTKAETAFLKSNGNMRIRRKLRQEFLVARKIFDKLLRKACRDYNRGLLNRIDEINTNNPREFWRTIKTLGPRKDKEIPIKVITVDGHFEGHPSKVLKSWENEFAEMSRKSHSFESEEFEDFYYDCLRQKEISENALQGGLL